MNAGDFALGSTIDVKFTTRQFSTGAPHQLAGTPVVSAYPDNSTTQITAGITLTVDFDSVTGLNNVRVVATSGNGYAAGSSYSLVITTGTVDSVSVVGEVIGSFTLERSAAYGRLGAPAGASVSADIAAVKTDTAAILVDTGTDGVVVAAASKTGYRLSATGVGDILTSTLTESYAADGAEFTVAQALYEIAQSIGDFSISGTTITVKQRDGTTSAMTYTLDDGTNPTSRTRS